MTERIHNVDALWIPHPLDMLQVTPFSVVTQPSQNWALSKTYSILNPPAASSFGEKNGKKNSCCLFSAL